MSMKNFPVSLKLEYARCLVIGGGSIAERKVDSLLCAGADVTLISPVVTVKLKQLFLRKKIKYICRTYRKGDAKGFFMIIAATNSPETNKKIYDEAVKKSILINCADDPEHCNFYMPAVIQKGDLQITVSSSGKAPYFTKKLKEHLDKYFYNGLGDEIKEIGKIRTQIIEKYSDNPKFKEKKMEEILKSRVDNIIKKLSER